MMKAIKEKWISFRWGIVNYLVVTNTYGYFGDVHVAVNYAVIHPALMPFLRDIVCFQASRRGVKIANPSTSPNGDFATQKSLICVKEENQK